MIRKISSLIQSLGVLDRKLRIQRHHLCCLTAGILVVGALITSLPRLQSISLEVGLCDVLVHAQVDLQLMRKSAFQISSVYSHSGVQIDNFLNNYL